MKSVSRFSRFVDWAAAICLGHVIFYVITGLTLVAPESGERCGGSFRMIVLGLLHVFFWGYAGIRRLP